MVEKTHAAHVGHAHHHVPKHETKAAGAEGTSVDTSQVIMPAEMDDTSFGQISALAAAGNPEAQRVLMDAERLLASVRQQKAAVIQETAAPAEAPAKQEAVAAALATTVETAAPGQAQVAAAAAVAGVATESTDFPPGHHTPKTGGPSMARGKTAA